MAHYFRLKRRISTMGALNHLLRDSCFQGNGGNNVIRSAFSFFTIAIVLLYSEVVMGQQAPVENGTMQVGVARIDITPEDPIRLAGYASRGTTESEGVIHKLWAKALAFGSDDQGASILITVDLIGIPGHVTRSLAKQLSKKIGLDPAHLVILASHTHGGPAVGTLFNILQYQEDTFNGSPLGLDQLVHIARYINQLRQKLEKVALAAMKDRSTAWVAWGQGQAGFARNRRAPGGPVDPALPVLRVVDPAGNLRAVLVNYACHGTTLTGEVNKIHGDWMGVAQRLIEANHPGAIAMVAIGAGGDVNPYPRGRMKHMRLHGKEIAANVEKLLASPLQPLTAPPVGRMKWVELPFVHVPTIPELIKQTKDNSVKAYYAGLALERIVRGHAIPTTLSYPVQTWTFGNELVMINLGGEVVADYALRLKNELGAGSLWVNAYANDVSSYIASRRVIREGGYEAETSMYYYNNPSPFVEEVEDIVITAVYDLLPASYTVERDTVNHPKLVRPESDGTLHLGAQVARAVGPEIQYMPEWKAFGWFTEADHVAWDVEVNKGGKYDVYLEWSVSDEEAGKPFIFQADDWQLKGKIGETGSWFTYKKEKIGTIRLLPGRQKMVFKAGSKSEKGALLDLRGITLIPVK